ncbi:protein Z-dependent protease inhibitor-like isoform X1, partial [Leptotrombidium deliense]
MAAKKEDGNLIENKTDNEMLRIASIEHSIDSLSLFLSSNVTNLVYDTLNIMFCLSMAFEAYTEKYAEALFQTSKLSAGFGSRFDATRILSNADLKHLVRSHCISVVSMDYIVKPAFKSYMRGNKHHTLLYDVNFNDKLDSKRDEDMVKKEFKSNLGNDVNVDFIEFNPNDVLNMYSVSIYDQKFLHPFNTSQTKNRIFLNHGIHEKRVKMMHQVVDLNYTKSEMFSAVIKPYENGDKLFVILPVEKDDYIDVIKNLSHSKITSLLKEMKLRRVELSLPKFTSHTTREMSTYPTSSEWHNLITEKDLLNKGYDPIKNNDGIYITSLKNVAIVKFDEQGTRVETKSFTRHKMQR